MTTRAIVKSWNTRLGRAVECSVLLSTRPPWTLKLQHPEVGHLEVEESDLFEALCRVRESLEKEDWILLCAGARIDTYPSSMCRQMSGGAKLYITHLGKPGELQDLVHLLDPADLALVGTVMQQNDFHKKWLKSFGRPK